MTFETDRFDEWIKQIEKLEGESRVEFGELFHSNFMKKNTGCESIEEFFEKSPWEINDEEDFEAIPPKGLDEYVDKNTVFPSWEEMIGTAGEEWIADQLEF